MIGYRFKRNIFAVVFCEFEREMGMEDVTNPGTGHGSLF